MARAEAMVAAYVAAGFTKLHLDTSMGCEGEPAALDDGQTADRAARLAAVAEAHCGDRPPGRVYIIGTEVPVPGGATHALDHLPVDRGRTPCATTLEVHRAAFAARGLADAFGRVVGLVVQPGVEFGHADVVAYDRAAAGALAASLADLPGLMFEAHSTDYQSAAALRALVEDGFAILKVGPWLTFALREALYALDALADVLDGTAAQGGLMAEMERVMQAAPANWQRYYAGDARELWLQRHFSLSDRIRYYWPEPAAARAADALLQRIEGRTVPTTVARQYLPWLADAGSAGTTEVGRRSVIEHVQRVLRQYRAAERA